jgi:uncharacterized membrane protein
MFFSIIGICLIISRNKKIYKNGYKKNDFIKYNVLRGLNLIIIGLLISIVTLIFLPETPIFFGVIHFIGISIIISLFFYKFKYFNILFSLFFILFGFLIKSFTFENYSIFHLILGFYPKNIWKITIDYFPIIPWFGWVLFGMFLGEVFYKNNKRIFYFPTIKKQFKMFKLLSFFGQNSLLIYIIHQPIIIASISLYVLF